MKPAVSQSRAATPREFADGLGVRTIIAERGSELLELLTLNPDFVRVPAFEFALRERVGRLANFRHAYFARVRRVDRLDGGNGLGIVSEHAVGARLSHILEVAEQHSLDLDVNAALCLIRQIVPAIAMLHHNARDVAHGVLAPERILVTPQARIVVTDYVLGSAVEQLGLSREGLWRELQVAVPPGAGRPRLDRRTDVMQIGLASLALILGRRLPLDDLRGLPELLASATETTVLGEREPISPPLRRWLARALQLDPRASFESAEDAQRGLEEVLSEEGGYVAAPVALEAFLLAYREHAAAADASSSEEESAYDPVQQGGAATIQPSMTALERPTTTAAAPVHLEPIAAPMGTPPAVAHRQKSAERTATAAAPRVAETFESQPRRAGKLGRIALVLFACIALAEGAYIWYLKQSPTGIPTDAGILTIESQPAGAAVLIDGRERGTTPFELRLSPGPHVVELRAGDQSRVVPLTIRAGVAHAQYIELPTGMAPLAAVPSGDPAVPAPGSELPAAATAAVPAAPAPEPAAPPPSVGWITVNAPYEMQIFESGKLIGRSSDGRIALPPGPHTLEIVNETLAFRTTRRVDVPANGVRRIPVQLPLGSISVNAIPWAEVWIDGERVGETPIGNLPIRIGPHEVVFKHPEFGEQRHAVSVTLAGPARLSVNMKP
ncbi:MAG TPA: PEGA domain-containing protein [Vicinamibacterales bacterium]|nr:PEGA domain-containing protein [Vicinamibacterales bacterium]